MVTINGIEFDVDLLDADVMEHLEDAAEEIQKQITAERKKNHTKASEFIRTFNGLTEGFIDKVLGEGASKLIFNGNQSMMEHMEAYNGIFKAKDEATAGVTEFADTFKNTYSPNRAARRAQQSGGKH